MKKNRLLLTIGGLLLIIFCFGLYISSNTQGFPLVLNSLTSNDIDIQINHHYWEAVQQGQIGVSPLGVRKITSTLLILDLTITNKMKKEFTSLCYVRDQNGKPYFHSPLGNMAAWESLYLVPIMPGESRRGKLAFQIQENQGALWFDCSDEIQIRIQ